MALKDGMIREMKRKREKDFHSLDDYLMYEYNRWLEERTKDTRRQRIRKWLKKLLGG